MRCYVLMGVSGCGKSSVGQALAQTCDMTFVDGDDYHPQANIEKMASGKPLNDDDRKPWLEKVGDILAKTDAPVVIACSALKRKYRDLIRGRVSEPVSFLHLYAAPSVLMERVTERTHHFMPPALLDSQYEALEDLEDDEFGALIDIDCPFEAVVGKAESYVRETLS